MNADVIKRGLTRYKHKHIPWEISSPDKPADYKGSTTIKDLIFNEWFGTNNLNITTTSTINNDSDFMVSLRNTNRFVTSSTNHFTITYTNSTGLSMADELTVDIPEYHDFDYYDGNIHYVHRTGEYIPKTLQPYGLHIGTAKDIKTDLNIQKSTSNNKVKPKKQFCIDCGKLLLLYDDKNYGRCIDCKVKMDREYRHHKQIVFRKSMPDYDKKHFQKVVCCDSVPCLSSDIIPDNEKQIVYDQKYGFRYIRRHYPDDEFEYTIGHYPKRFISYLENYELIEDWDEKNKYEKYNVMPKSSIGNLRGRASVMQPNGRVPQPYDSFFDHLDWRKMLKGEIDKLSLEKYELNHDLSDFTVDIIG